MVKPNTDRARTSKRRTFGNKAYKSSTKNNIHHFGTIIKKILDLKAQKGLLPRELADSCGKSIANSTSLESFRGCYSDPIVRDILLSSMDSGQFISFFLASDIQIKTDAIIYLNVLFNSFVTGKLDRWIEGKRKTQKNTQQARGVKKAKGDFERESTREENDSELQYGGLAVQGMDDIVDSDPLGIVDYSISKLKESSYSSVFELSEDCPFWISSAGQ